MLSIIGYLFFATLMSALTKFAAARKTFLWDCIGCTPFFASIFLSVGFGIKVMSLIHTPAFSDPVILTWHFLGTAFFISLGVIGSYVAGDALLTRTMDYAQARRKKQLDDANPTQ